MRKATIEALHGSVEKWINIATWQGDDNGSANCPLCTRFMHDSEAIYCRRNDPKLEKCPVYLHTGRQVCDSTPYDQWMRAQDAAAGNDPVQHPLRVVDEATQFAAECEALFLISLLPEAEQARYYE